MENQQDKESEFIKGGMKTALMIVTAILGLLVLFLLGSVTRWMITNSPDLKPIFQYTLPLMIGTGSIYGLILFGHLKSIPPSRLWIPGIGIFLLTTLLGFIISQLILSHNSPQLRIGIRLIQLFVLLMVLGFIFKKSVLKNKK